MLASQFLFILQKITLLDTLDPKAGGKGLVHSSEGGAAAWGRIYLQAPNNFLPSGEFARVKLPVS